MNCVDYGGLGTQATFWLFGAVSKYLSGHDGAVFDGKDAVDGKENSEEKLC